MALESEKLLSSLAIGLAIVFMGGCQKSTSRLEKQIDLAEGINRLDRRLERLERRAGIKPSLSPNNDNKAPSGPIKSLTFRQDTKDDRLRIYWADGSKSDLPCTKEQSIWVCG